MQRGEGVVIGGEICGGDQLLDLRVPLTSHRRVEVGTQKSRIITRSKKTSF